MASLRVFSFVLLCGGFLQPVSGSNSSSCNKHSNCNDCIGTFSTNANCVWCSSTKECVSNSDEHGSCPEEDQEDSCDTPYYTIIFILVLGFLVCICLVSCFFREWNRRRRDLDPRMRAPLLGRTRNEVLRNSVAEGEWMCVICGFDNTTHKMHCTMCGTTQDFTSEYRIEKIKESEKRKARRRSIKIADDAQISESTGHSVSALTTRSSLTPQERKEAFNYRRLNQLSIRQKSARRRKMWQRTLDEETGELVWTRAAFKDKNLPVANSKSWFTSFGNSNDSSTSREALLAAAHAVTPPPKKPQKDSFDATLVSTSPGYVSQFTEEGKLDWERVEPGRRTSTTLGAAPHYSGAVYDPKVIDVSMTDLSAVAAMSFSEKQLWFLDHMALLQRPWSEGHIRVDIERAFVLEHSFHKMMCLRRSELHQWMRISFRGEEGLDAGGLEREWFALVAEKIFDPTAGLFSCSSGEAANAGNYFINPTSGHDNQFHLEYFQFAGRFLGKAIMEQQSLIAYLSLPLRKQILSLPVTFSDLEFVDTEVYQNLMWLLQNDNVENLGLYFTIDYQAPDGAFVTYELKENGADIAVTDDNKQEYLQLRLRHRMLDSIKPQLEMFLTGFYEVVPPVLLCVFDYQELELLMCGIPDLDVADWKKHTEYLGVYNRPGRDLHKVIKWFWEEVTEMTSEERVRLLQFVTGSGRLPAHGFKALQSNDGNFRKFNIQSISKQESSCPRSHTCFNKLDLPVYESKEELEAYMSVVINMEVTGFTME